jgi:hypothetical protein
MARMCQLTQLAGGRRHQRLPPAPQQRPAQLLLVPGRAAATPSARPGGYAPSSRPRRHTRHDTPPALAATTSVLTAPDTKRGSLDAR